MVNGITVNIFIANSPNTVTTLQLIGKLTCGSVNVSN